jgi:hypothetical protein
MPPHTTPSSRGAAVLAVTGSDGVHTRLLNVFLAMTALGLVSIWVYLNPFSL